MSGLRHLPRWTRLALPFPPDATAERRIRDLVGQLTLAEKVGQMIQPELAELRPEDVTQFKIGSALNGAGIWPGGKRWASVADWVDTVDTFWVAAEAAYRDRPFRIPFAWATDAVHGHNNVYGHRPGDHRDRYGLDVRAHRDDPAGPAVGPLLRGVLGGSGDRPPVRRRDGPRAAG
jgi:hypothetical protein